jgi:hypothetical protein
MYASRIISGNIVLLVLGINCSIITELIKYIYIYIYIIYYISRILRRGRKHLLAAIGT